MAQFLPHSSLHDIDIIFDRSKLTTSQIKLVDDLVTPLAQFSSYKFVHLSQEVVAFGTIVFRLPLLKVEKVAVLHSHDSCSVGALL